MTSSAWWARLGIPWSYTWGLILSFHSFWSLSIGEGAMGSSVVTRSCRALGAEKLPITRVVPNLVNISLPSKGVGHSGTTRNWWENICPSEQQRSAQVNLLVVAFPVAPTMVQVWGAPEQEIKTEQGKGKMAEEQDRKTTFSLTNSSKEHFSAEQTPQNNFCRLAEDIRQPEKQTIVFKNSEPI